MDPRKHFHLCPGPKRHRGPLAPLRNGAEITSATTFIYCLNQRSIPMSHVYHAGSLLPLLNRKCAVCVCLCMYSSTYTFISPNNCPSSNSIPITHQINKTVPTHDIMITHINLSMEYKMPRKKQQHCHSPFSYFL